MLMSLDLIDYNKPSLNVWEFLSLSDKFPALDSGLGRAKLLSLDNIFSYNAKIFIRLLCDLLASPRRYR
jgi:hypothetical protein